jgi:hypothetical protein
MTREIRPPTEDERARGGTLLVAIRKPGPFATKTPSNPELDRLS